MAMNTRTLIGRLDRDISNAERDRVMLDKYTAGLKAARAELSSAVMKQAAKPTHKERQPRTEVLTEIFRGTQDPITMDDIMKELANRGRSDDRRSVHATLSYLKRCNVAHSVSRGKWVAAAAA